MNYDIVNTAVYLARREHSGQVRKYNKTPYWLHLARVAGITSAYTTNPEVVAAAWLHDILEDTPFRYSHLVKEVGLRVTNLVQVLTKPERENGINRKQRNKNYWQDLKQFQNLCRDEGIAPTTLIKLSDRYDNIRELDYEDDFYKVYVKETHELLETLNVDHELVDLIEIWVGPA